MIKNLLNSMPSGVEITNEEAQLSAQAEIVASQQDIAVDHANEVKADQATCNTGSFQDSSFLKTLRNLSSLELPSAFVKKNGYNFQAKVVLRGLSGRFAVVHLKIVSSPIQDRVYFRGSEWRDFLLENGFEVGYQLLFSLVSKSIFIVRHPGAENVHIQECMNSIEEPKICDDMRRTNLPESYVKPFEKLVEVRHGRDSSWGRSSGRESPVNNAITDKPSKSHLKNDIIYSRGKNDWDCNCKRTVDMLVGNLQCPHFVTRINKSHLRQWKSSTMSVPREFYTKYAAYFSEGANIFKGPNGRMMKLHFSNNSLRFTSGWKAFHRENGINLGDVLLFSLCEPAQWLVQFVEHKTEEVPTGSECDDGGLE